MFSDHINSGNNRGTMSEKRKEVQGKLDHLKQDQNGGNTNIFLFTGTGTAQGSIVFPMIKIEKGNKGETKKENKGRTRKAGPYETGLK